MLDKTQAINMPFVLDRFRKALRTALYNAFFWICLAISTCKFVPVWAAGPDRSIANRNSEMAIARGEFNSGDFAHAAEKLARMLRTSIHLGADAYRMLAFSQFKLGNNYDALSTCENGLALYPSSNSLGNLYVSILRQALSPEARNSRLKASVQRVRHSPIVLKALGEELLSSNPQDAQALQLLSSAATLAPRDAEAHFFYGEAACFNQEDTLCIEELRRAHELNPRNEQANMQLYTMIAVAEDKHSLPKQAARDFERAMTANRSLVHPSPYAALKYATFLGTQDRRDEAVMILEEIIGWQPSYGPAHFARATFLSEQGKKEDAIAEAEIALQDSRSSEAELRAYHAFLARTYFSIGRQNDALSHQSWVESHPQR
jgi:tetratricopeptide (TPR) repeat protein